MQWLIWKGMVGNSIPNASVWLSKEIDIFHTPETPGKTSAFPYLSYF